MQDKNIRFSSVKDLFKNNEETKIYKMVVPYTDLYKVNFKGLRLTILDENNQELITKEESFNISLEKNQIITIKVTKLKGKVISFKVMAKAHKIVMPFEPNWGVNSRTYRTHGDATIDPCKPCEIKVTKRNLNNSELYINCNNPEKLTKDDMNKALSRVDVTNKKVYFTFEHNNYDQPFYYGYQVKNTGNEDIYVTVLNIGYHIEGPGCWLGQDEWIQFYNLNFKYDESKWNEKQKQTFLDYFNFSHDYKAHLYQPITYRIPKGKYIYVMGGTTKDSYNHINVFNTADKIIKPGCSNGAVLFDVVGKAEGSFFVYDDPSKIKNNNTHQGYVIKRNGQEYGRQYLGYEPFDSVIDTNIVYTFNDLTPKGALKTKFTNYYDETIKHDDVKAPFTKINRKPHLQELDYWVTHISSQGSHDGIGTDLTKYITVNEEGKEVTIEDGMFDGCGKLANLGNWMTDYMDHYLFVNQGDKEREITISMTNTGSLCVFRREADGKVIKNSEIFTFMMKNNDEKYEPLNDGYTYTFKIKPHSMKKFIIEYNLLANSCGHVPHKVTLN